MHINPYLLTAVAAWLMAQILKTILHLAIYRKLDFGRLFGDGGMPSGHSSTVSALAVICGLRLGFESTEFAISAVLALIVCHDAMGVRWETGKQAKVLNELRHYLETGDETDLKELVGHTPLQVVAGVILGIGVAVLMFCLILR